MRNFALDFSTTIMEVEKNNETEAQKKPRTMVTLPFLLMAVFFCVFLIVSNMMEVKLIQIGSITATSGLIVFPLSYILNDCLVEVYGFRRARLVIWLGFLMNLVVVLLLQLALVLPEAEVCDVQDAVQLVWGCTPRILLASLVAFVCGSMLNAFVISKMKLRSEGKGFSVRAIASTLVGEGADSLVFFPIAFGGIYSLPTIIGLVWTQALMKTLYEVIVLPLTIRVVKAVKRIESLDTYDNGINYSWWKLGDM